MSHVHYQKIIVKVNGRIQKFKNFPKDKGGFGETLEE
tara:strand:- start:306 stop:416 length:111 start_codon:yes stop_codon:yes gene_type:complete